MYKALQTTVTLAFMKKAPPEKIDVRLPAEMRERLKKKAEEESRSLNQQAVAYIRAGLSSSADHSEQLNRIEALLVDVLSRLGDK